MITSILFSKEGITSYKHQIFLSIVSNTQWKYFLLFQDCSLIISLQLLHYFSSVIVTMHGIGYKSLNLPVISTHECRKTGFPRSKPIHRSWQMRPAVYPIANEALNCDYYKEHILKRRRPTTGHFNVNLTSISSDPTTKSSSKPTILHMRAAASAKTVPLKKAAGSNKMTNISGSCILYRRWWVLCVYRRSVQIYSYSSR